MKKELFVAALAAGFIAGPAYAGDVEDKCNAYVEANGGDASGCSCLDEKAEGEAREEILAIDTPDDLEYLSDGTKEVIAACFPGAGQ